MDTSGFLISSAMRATTWVRSWSCSAPRRSWASRRWAVRSSNIEHRAHGLGAIAHHRVGRDLEGQVAEGELHLDPRHRASLGQGLEEHVAERGGQHPQVPVQHLPRRHAEDLRGAAVDRDDLLVGIDGDDAARHAGEDPLVEFLLVLEQVVHADVADGGGQVGSEIEQGLGLVAPVAAAGDPLAQGEDADQLPVRAERDGHHRLQDGQLAGDLPGRGIRDAALGLLELDEPALGGQPQRQAAVRAQGERLHHVRRQSAIRGDAVVARGRIAEQDGAAARARQLRHSVEELVQHARQIEAGRERLRELLRHLGQRVRGHGRARHRDLVGGLGGGTPRRPQGGHFLEQAELVLGLLEQALQVPSRERLEQHEVGRLRRALVLGARRSPG